MSNKTPANGSNTQAGEGSREDPMMSVAMSGYRLPTTAEPVTIARCRCGNWIYERDLVQTICSTCEFRVRYRLWGDEGCTAEELAIVKGSR